MPSASPVVRPRLYVRIECEITGVGVTLSSNVDHDLHPIGREHFEHTDPSGLRQGVGIPTEKERAIYLIGATVETDCLGDRQDVRFVEAQPQ